MKAMHNCAYCERIASRKYNGEWVCLEHLGRPTMRSNPLARPYRKGAGAVKNDPEKWKEYNRKYRANYRLTHERTDKKKAVYWRQRIGHLWLLGIPETNEQALYHCELCCSQVVITKKEVAKERKRFVYDKEYWWWHKGGRYSSSVCFEVDLTGIKHSCKEYPSKKVRYVNCDRCGVEGTNRAIHQYYYNDTLCPDCWCIMKPLYRMEYEYTQLMNTLSEFRSTMRKSGLSIQKVRVNDHWIFDSGIRYIVRENWYRHRHSDTYKVLAKHAVDRQLQNI